MIELSPTEIVERVVVTKHDSSADAAAGKTPTEVVVADKRPNGETAVRVFRPTEPLTPCREHGIVLCVRCDEGGEPCR